MWDDWAWSITFIFGHPSFTNGWGYLFFQPKYVLNLLQKFKMEDYKMCATPYQLEFKITKECDSMKVDATLY